MVQTGNVSRGYRRSGGFTTRKPKAAPTPAPGPTPVPAPTPSRAPAPVQPQNRGGSDTARFLLQQAAQWEAAGNKERADDFRRKAQEILRGAAGLAKGGIVAGDKPKPAPRRKKVPASRKGSASGTWPSKPAFKFNGPSR